MKKFNLWKHAVSIALMGILVVFAVATSPGDEGQNLPYNDVALTFINESSIDKVRVEIHFDGVHYSDGSEYINFVIVANEPDEAVEIGDNNFNKIYIYKTDIINKIEIFDESLFDEGEGAVNIPLLSMNDDNKNFSTSFTPEFSNAVNHSGEYVFTITDVMLGL